MSLLTKFFNCFATLFEIHDSSRQVESYVTCKIEPLLLLISQMCERDKERKRDKERENEKSDM